MDSAEPCEFLSWDTNFFGFRIGRVNGHKLSSTGMINIIKWCQENKIECLYFLADTDDLETERMVIEHNFLLVDIRITMETKLLAGAGDFNSISSNSLIVRQSRASDLPALRMIAEDCYKFTRFYFDPGFSEELCSALYKTWLNQSCEGYADEVLVAETTDTLVGYITCHLTKNTTQPQIGLVGVAPEVRGNGVGRSLVNHALEWFSSHGANKVLVVTQARNIPALRLYQECGFRTKMIQIWYHKWIRTNL